MALNSVFLSSSHKLPFDELSADYVHLCSSILSRGVYRSAGHGQRV